MRHVPRARLLLVSQVLVALVVAVVVVPRALGCIELEVSTSIENGKVEAVRNAAREYNRGDHRVGGRCVRVHVNGTTSGLARQALESGRWDSYRDGQGRAPEGPRPQVWLPTSSMWLDLLHNSGRIDGLPPVDQVESIAYGTLVVAVPETMVGQEGWPDETFGWSDLLVPDGGRPDPAAGENPFLLDRDDAQASTTGLGTSVAIYSAAARAEHPGQPSRALVCSDVADDALLDPALGVEAKVQNYVPEITEHLERMAADDAVGRPPTSAIALQEQLLYEYNSGGYSPDRDSDHPTPPRTRLIALYPTDGVLGFDHPYVVLPWASRGQEAAAEDFLEHLEGPAVQQKLTEVGFRDLDRELDLGGNDGRWGLRERIDPDEMLEAPGGDVLQEILDEYDTVRKPANILLLFDVSGSLERRLDDGRTGADAVREALERGLDHLPEDNTVGLWAFPASAASGSDEAYEELVGRGEFDPRQKEEILGAVRTLPSINDKGTPLYGAIQEAYGYQLDHYEPDAINAVVVLTDGDDDKLDPADGPSREDLLSYLGTDTGDRSVQVFSIALPGTGEFEDMRDISLATGAHAFPADRPDSLSEAFVSVFAQLGTDPDTAADGAPTPGCD